VAASRYVARMESGALLTKGGRRYKHSTVDTTRSALRALREAFGDRPLDSISRIEAEDWAAGVAPGKIQPAVTLMNEAYRAELIDRNRFEGLGPRVEGRRNEPPPSEDEMQLLLDGCSALGDYAPMMRALLTFAAFTLMRPGELFALDWETSTWTLAASVSSVGCIAAEPTYPSRTRSAPSRSSRPPARRSSGRGCRMP
jgi:integrase